VNKFKLLIAESDEDLLSVLELMLEDDFELTMTSTVSHAVELLGHNNYHIVIVSVHLKDQSGLAICEFAEELAPNHRPSIVVLSNDMSDEIIHRSFSLGATDFIGKPFNVVAFHERLMRLSRDIVQVKALRGEDNRRRSLADTAMKQAAAYGSGLDLLARLNTCRSVDSLMEKVVYGLLAQGYHCAVEFRSETETYNFDADTRSCSQNEKKVFQLLHDKGRIFTFGKRTIFNETNASLLVKNMPTEGTTSYDAAIDLLAKLVPALGSRFDALLNLQAMVSSREQLNDTIALISQTLQSIEQDRKDKLDAISAAIGVSFHELEMTEDQEKFFLDLIEKQLSADDPSDKFSEVLTLLTNVAERLSGEHLNEEEDDDFFDDDAELF